MKKFCVDSINKDKPTQPGVLFISRSDIGWSQLINPIVEYLAKTGFLLFQNKTKIYLNEYFIYCNINEIKAFDWVNNCVRSLKSATSSPTAFFETLTNDFNSSKSKSNILMEKYLRKTEKVTKIDKSALKRRFSDDDDITNDESASIEEDMNFSVSANANQTSLSDLSIDSDKMTKSINQSSLNEICGNKQFKQQRLMTPTQAKQLPPSELDVKFDDLLKVIKYEKEINDKFESKLCKISMLDPENENMNENLMFSNGSGESSSKTSDFRLENFF